MCRKKICIGINFSLGVLVWALSPFFGISSGLSDSPGYFVLALFITGVLGSFISPQNFILSWLANFLGQVVYLFLFMEQGPLFLVGIIVLFFYSFLVLFGSVFVFVLKKSFEQGQP